jgi:predicted metal-dependent hydrolase
VTDLEIVRHPTARRIRLTLDPASGRAKLVVPRRAALKPALAWAQGKADWLAEQRAQLPQPQPYAPGLTLTVADEVLTLAWTPGASRRVDHTPGLLSLSGPAETLPRRVYAARAGVTVSRVAIGDAKGRWGSCASSGIIRYSWRLILAPGWVRRATVAHEVAHRVHMNHSAAFHALVAELYGADPTPARAWLRRHGAALHWVGRSS